MSLQIQVPYLPSPFLKKFNIVPSKRQREERKIFCVKIIDREAIEKLKCYLMHSVAL
jgi:hypothetical protein